MTPTYNAYGGVVIHKYVDRFGNRYETNNFSDQDICVALGKMIEKGWIWAMPGFFEHHRLTPAMVAIAINTVNPDADGESDVATVCALYSNTLGKWYAADPLEGE